MLPHLFMLFAFVSASAEPARLVSVSPTVTELIYALDAGNELVGVTRFCDYPEAANKVAKIGGFVDPSVEAVVALHPTLVVLNPNIANKGFAEALQRFSIRTLVLHDGGVTDFAQMVTTLGDALSRQQQAQQLIKRFEADMAALRSHPLAIVGNGQKPLRVLWLYGHRPLIAAGPKSFASDLLSSVGWENAYSGDQRYPSLSYESLLSNRPNLVVDVDMGESSDEKLVAMAKNRFRYERVTDSALMRLSPRLPAAMRGLLDRLQQSSHREPRSP